MIDRTLFVILGAGASYDASEYYGSVESRPPLTAGLFARRFDPILEDYPMAVNAAPDIRDAISGAGAIPAVSLEDHLRLRYAESADEYDKRRYLSLPLYLQHVLLSVSGRGVPQSHHFDRLLNRLVGSFEHVCFVTLNYDLLLDRSLSRLNSLQTMADYLQTRWSLIKPHGSVNWGWIIRDHTDADLKNPPHDLPDRLDSTITHSVGGVDHTTHGVAGVRVGQRADGQQTPIFPALSVPLGPDDTLACPQPHLDRLRNLIDEAVDGLDLLFVGYSGIDSAVQRLIAERGRPIRSLTVVNAGIDASTEVIGRVLTAFGLAAIHPDRVNQHDGGFSSWATGSLAGFPDWVGRLPPA